MFTNESLLVAKYFFLDLKFQKIIFKLKKLVGLIFGKVEFWATIWAEDCQNLTKNLMDLKMVLGLTKKW